MKSIMLAIQPQWVEKILSGEKTIEVRKTAPKETPFKGYIYQTRKKWLYKILPWLREGQGKVVAEFICNRVEDFSEWKYDYPSLLRHIDLYAGTKGDYHFLNNYLKGKKKGYALYITDLKIYDQPKELSEFVSDKECTMDYQEDNCSYCKSAFFYNEDKHSGESETAIKCLTNYMKPLTKAPQSWQFVKELK